MKRLLVISSLILLVAGCAQRYGGTSTGGTTAAGTQQGAATGTAGTTQPAGQQPAPPALAAQDASFIRDAAQANQAAIQLGRLAEQQGTSPAVKQMGQSMVKDHTQLNSQLQQIAASKGITLPASPSTDQQNTINQLSGLSGQQFDQAFQKQVIQDHQQELAKFQAEASQGQDPDLKAFAQKAVPGLQQHLNMAQSMQVGAPATTEQGTPPPSTPPQP